MAQRIPGSWEGWLDPEYARAGSLEEGAELRGAGRERTAAGDGCREGGEPGLQGRFGPASSLLWASVGHPYKAPVGRSPRPQGPKRTAISK